MEVREEYANSGMEVHAESLSADMSKNTQPKTKKNPIAAVRYVIGGELNKIKLMTIRMAQAAYDISDINQLLF